MDRSSISNLGDEELIKRVDLINTREHSATVELVVHLIEVEGRKLYLGLGYSNLFTYCRERLGYSEPGAYRRITAARAIRDFPEIYEMLERKEVSLTTLAIFAGILTNENKGDVLERVRKASRASVEAIVTSYRAPKVVRDSVKPIVQKAPIPQSPPLPMFLSAPKALEVKPAIPIETKFKIQFAAGSSFMKKLTRLKELRGNQEFEELFEALMDLYLERTDPKARIKRRENKPKMAKLKPAPESRYIPIATRDLVLKRENHQCSFVSSDGRRCSATCNLQIDHKIPFALGGHSTPDNLRVLCAAHNQYAAVQVFGKEFMQRFSPVKGS